MPVEPHHLYIRLVPFRHGPLLWLLLPCRQKRLLESIYFFGHRLAEAALSYLPEGVISIPDAAA